MYWEARDYADVKIKYLALLGIPVLAITPGPVRSYPQVARFERDHGSVAANTPKSRPDNHIAARIKVNASQLPAYPMLRLTHWSRQISSSVIVC
jgi:hypothetical protein